MKSKNVCKDLTFEDCELAILRMAVDKAEEKIGKRIVNSEDIKNIIKIISEIIYKNNVKATFYKAMIKLNEVILENKQYLDIIDIINSFLV